MKCFQIDNTSPKCRTIFAKFWKIHRVETTMAHCDDDRSLIVKMEQVSILDPSRLFLEREKGKVYRYMIFKCERSLNSNNYTRATRKIWETISRNRQIVVDT